MTARRGIDPRKQQKTPISTGKATRRQPQSRTGISVTSTEPGKAFETTAQDLFWAPVSMVGLLLHAAVGNSGGLGLGFPNRQGLAAPATWRASARRILADVALSDIVLSDIVLADVALSDVAAPGRIRPRVRRVQRT